MHFPLNSRGASEIRKLGEEGVNRGTDTDDFDAGDPRAGGRLGRDAVQQAVVCTVH
jgi:hypothetical protein